MFRRLRGCIVPALIVLLVAAAPAFGEESRVATETSLRPSPGGDAISAFLTAGTPVEILEHADGWVRVRVEGWVRTSTVAQTASPPPEPSEPTAPPPAPTPATSQPPSAPSAVRTEPPQTAPPSGPTGASVEGLIRIKSGRLRKVNGAGASVMLLPAGFDLDGTNADRAEPARKLAELDAEAERLKKEAEDAMHGSNFTEATLLRDDLMEQREAVVAERLDLLAAEHGRHEQIARSAAVASTVADAKGWFRLVPAQPGTYVLYARWTRAEADLEWVETLTLDGVSLRIDLDGAKAHGALTR